MKGLSVFLITLVAVASLASAQNVHRQQNRQQHLDKKRSVLDDRSDNAAPHWHRRDDDKQRMHLRIRYPAAADSVGGGAFAAASDTASTSSTAASTTAAGAGGRGSNNSGDDNNDSDQSTSSSTNLQASSTSSTVSTRSTFSISSSSSTSSTDDDLFTSSSSTSTTLSTAATTTSDPLSSDSTTAFTSAETSDTSEDSSTSQDVDNITLTSTVQPETSSTETSSSETETGTSASSSSGSEKKSSGISKSTIIIIIVVASCVGGAIAIWTIIRKIKLSPSSRFNRKLAPVDFGVGRRDSDIFNNDSTVNFAANSGSGASSEPWPVHRSPSQSSHGHGSGSGGLSRNASVGNGLDRSNSFGKDVGGSVHASGPSMTEIAALSNFYPSLPPQSRSNGNIYNMGSENAPYPPTTGHNAYSEYGGQSEYDYDAGATRPGLAYSGSTRRLY